MRRADDRDGGLPRPVRRLLRFAELRDGRAHTRPQIGIRVAAARAPKLLADATRLVPSARPPVPEAAVPGRPLLRAALPSGPLAQAPALAPAWPPPEGLVSAREASSTAPTPHARAAAPANAPLSATRWVIDPDRARAWADTDSPSESGQPAEAAGQQRGLARVTSGPAPARGARIVEGPAERTAPATPAAAPPAPETRAATPPMPPQAPVAHVEEGSVRASARRDDAGPQPAEEAPAQGSREPARLPPQLEKGPAQTQPA